LIELKLSDNKSFVTIDGRMEGSPPNILDTSVVI